MNTAPYSAADNAARQAKEELQRFAYIVSHDLQEQLRNISNYTGLIAKHHGSTEDEDFKFYLNVLTESSAKLNEQLAVLLAYSRIGRNTVFEQVDCNVIVQDILAEMTDIIIESQAKVMVKALPVVSGNKQELKLVFQNIIGNALKFKQKDNIPIINIECRNKSVFWEFSISDNGIGIAEKHFKKIFQMFQRLNSAEDYPGAGTGLALCKKIIEWHKGEIWVSSGPGIGSVFNFTIPYKQDI